MTNWEPEAVAFAVAVVFARCSGNWHQQIQEKNMQKQKQK